MHITTEARGEFADLLVVANTRHGPGGHYHARPAAGEGEHDHLNDAGEARRFLADHAVVVPDTPPARADLVALREVRETVRSLAGDPVGTDPAPTDGTSTLAGSSVRRGPALPEDVIAKLIAGRTYRLDVRGLPQPVTTGWPGVVDALIPALLALADASDRLRVCSNPACRFAFVDRSRNRSRRWCESAFCGNRIRVARHRHRAARRSLARDPG